MKNPQPAYTHTVRMFKFIIILQTITTQISVVMCHKTGSFSLQQILLLEHIISMKSRDIIVVLVLESYSILSLGL